MWESDYSIFWLEIFVSLIWIPYGPSSSLPEAQIEQLNLFSVEISSIEMISLRRKVAGARILLYFC